MTLDNERPMSLAESEAVAATLVGLGYSARSYPLVRAYGYTVIVTGSHGKGRPFRYVIRDAAQLPKALDDLARGETGGSETLVEGV